MVSGVNSLINIRLDMATLLTLNKKYCYSYLNGLADVWCLKGRRLPISDLFDLAMTFPRELSDNLPKFNFIVQQGCTFFSMINLLKSI